MALFSRPEPGEVFTPTKLPLGKTQVYAHRSLPEREIRTILSDGNVPVVFGEYGVGKTTVVRKFIQDQGEANREVYIATVSNKTMSDVIKVALEKLNYSIDVSESLASTHSGKFGARLVANLNYEGTQTRSKSRSFVVQAPTDDKVAGILRDEKIVLVLDELHRADDDFRSELADLIKTTKGQTSDYPKIVLIGTTLESASLVNEDPGINRFVKEARVRPMTPAEAREVVSVGFDRLKMTLSPELLQRTIRTAAGAPSLLQSLCRDMARSCLDDNRVTVETKDYKEAVQRYLRENGLRLAQYYTGAIEHTGQRRYRKQILIAMSHIDSEYVELEQIRAKIQERTGLRTDQTALSGPLRVLKEGKGALLRDVQKRDGDRLYNVSAFVDPMMKSFIRFHNEAEEQGLVEE